MHAAPMCLLQVIAHAPNFPKAVQKMTRALGEYNIRGIKTNITFLENVMRHPEFLAVGGSGCWQGMTWSLQVGD